MKELINEYIKMTATEAVARLRSREISPLELVEASIQRIEAVDSKVNALPIHCFERHAHKQNHSIIWHIQITQRHYVGYLSG